MKGHELHKEPITDNCRKRKGSGSPKNRKKSEKTFRQRREMTDTLVRVKESISGKKRKEQAATFTERNIISLARTAMRTDWGLRIDNPQSPILNPQSNEVYEIIPLYPIPLSSQKAEINRIPSSSIMHQHMTSQNAFLLATDFFQCCF
jgi:hypothetical protein